MQAKFQSVIYGATLGCLLVASNGFADVVPAPSLNAGTSKPATVTGAVQAPVKPIVLKTGALKLEQTAAAKLLALVLDSYIPKVLFQEKNQPWLGGTRSMTITKAGAAVLTSDARNIVVSFPLKANLIGDINTNIVLMQIKAHCLAQFTAPAKIVLAVDFNKKPIAVKTQINVTVPPVMADCDGYKLAVENIIQAVIEQQKPQWEKDIQTQISDGLMVLGL